MTELAIRLLLPVAAGYLTFALIARQAMPWSKPAEARHQPRWVLACWLGAAVALTSTLIIYMQLAGHVSATPALVVFALLAALGVKSWFTSRRKAKQALVDAGKDASEQWDLDILEFDDKDQANPIAKQSEKTLELSEYDLAFDQAHRDCTTAMARNTPSQADDLLTPSGRSDGRSDSGQTDSVTRQTDTGLNQTEYDTAFEQAYASCKSAMASDFSVQAHNLSRHHQMLRNEAEKNLRITRRALANSESQVAQQSSARSDALIELESQLKDQIRLTAKAEHKILAETEKRCVAEHKLATIKELMLQAKTEVRKNTDARARAVLTARKAVNFARRSIDARALSEKKLENIKSQLELQNNNVSNLIRTLEKEKQRNKQLHHQMEVSAELNLNRDEFRVLQTPDKTKNKSAKFTSAGALLRKVSRQT